MVCIETVSFSIEINGHKFDMWKPKRGIRQGNPLSLCIFIICLSSLISKFVDGHKSAHFDGFQINKHTPPIPIICFADDCILFCKNNPKSLNFFQNTLKTFESEAGLSINKSKAFFSKNTSNNRIREICYLLNLKRGNIGEKYLGPPFNIQRITKETFCDIIIKTQSKISTWYNKFLSYAGRCMVVKHVLNTLPLYITNSQKFPKSP